MGQAANSNRNASLDEKKARARGRAGDRSPSKEAIKDAKDPQPAKGRTGGAFGKTEKINRTGIVSQGGGGGGGSAAQARDNNLTVGTRKTPARKRGASAR